MNILLIQARVEPYTHIPNHQPVGLMTLAQCLRDSNYLQRLICKAGRGVEYNVPHFNIKILDFQTVSEDFDANFPLFLRKFDPDIVGFRTHSASISESIRLAQIVKQTTNAVTIFGGMHFSALPDEMIALDCVDFGIRGEGEETFPLLVVELAQENPCPSYLHGVYLKKTSNGKVRNTGVHIPFFDLDQYPSFTDAIDLIDETQYGICQEECIHGTIKSRLALLFTSRGCNNNCTFCSQKQVFEIPEILKELHKQGRLKGRVRYCPLDYVIDQMRAYYQRGYRIFIIKDDALPSDNKRVKDLAKRIMSEELQIAWCCMARADSVDYETLTLMLQSGNSGIGFGLESGDPDILKKLGKRLKLKAVMETHRICVEVNIRHKWYLIQGLPGQDFASVLKTAKFLCDMYDYAHPYVRSRQVHHFDANVSYFVPYPGAKLYGDPRIVMLEHKGKKIEEINWRHGPPERANLEHWVSPTATDVMTRQENTRARNYLVEIVRKLAINDRSSCNKVLKILQEEAYKQQSVTSRASVG